MLFVLFSLGRDRYAIDALQVAEVLPLVELKELPHAPPGIAGLFSYRGTPVPAVDLSRLALGRAASLRLSTRIILVHYDAGRPEGQLLGLIAERVTGTIRRDPADFRATGVSGGPAPWLGPVTNDAGGMIQRVELAALLPPELRARLQATGAA